MALEQGRKRVPGARIEADSFSWISALRAQSEALVGEGAAVSGFLHLKVTCRPYWQVIVIGSCESSISGQVEPPAAASWATARFLVCSGLRWLLWRDLFASDLPEPGLNTHPLTGGLSSMRSAAGLAC